MNRLRTIRLLTEVLSLVANDEPFDLTNDEDAALAELWAVLHRLHIQLTFDQEGVR